jgi:hypothetical protein
MHGCPTRTPRSRPPSARDGNDPGGLRAHGRTSNPEVAIRREREKEHEKEREKERERGVDRQR